MNQGILDIQEEGGLSDEMCRMAVLRGYVEVELPRQMRIDPTEDWFSGRPWPVTRMPPDAVEQLRCDAARQHRIREFLARAAKMEPLFEERNDVAKW